VLGASSMIAAPSPVPSSEIALSTTAKGGGRKPSGGGGTTSGGGYTLSITMVSDANSNGAPNWGDKISFNISTSATSQPDVAVTCYQNGTLVYSQETGYWSGYPFPWTQVMTMSSGAWSSGGASCDARVFYYGGDGSPNTLGTTNFTVAP
jgi:hypothetical protein